MKKKVNVSAEDGEKYKTKTTIIEKKVQEQTLDEGDDQVESQEQDDDKVVTVRDLCKIGRTDCPSKRRELLFNTVTQACGKVLNQREYRVVLTNAGNEKGVISKIKDIMKLPFYRKDVVSYVTKSLAYKGKLPNYVVVFGNDYELHVKYKKQSLMQILIADTWNLTLFEVPRITLNFTTENMILKDEELPNLQKFKECQVEILDNYAQDPKINDFFKNKCCESFQETLQYYCHELNKPKSKQNK